MAKGDLGVHKDKILNLGSLHEENVAESKNQRIRKILPILLLVGIILILFGAFYKNILSFISMSKNIFDKKDTTVTNEQILRCSSKVEDDNTKIAANTVVTYHFDKDLLKKIDVKKTFQPLSNGGDIATSNLEVYNKKYQEIAKKLQNINGYSISVVYKNDIITTNIKIDYENFDVKNNVSNELYSVTNTKDQTYRSIKEIEGKAGHICSNK